MADNQKVCNSPLSTNNDDYTVATDEVGGVHYQRVKLDIGADGESEQITSTNALPVSVKDPRSAPQTIFPQSCARYSFLSSEPGIDWAASQALGDSTIVLDGPAEKTILVGDFMQIYRSAVAGVDTELNRVTYVVTEVTSTSQFTVSPPISDMAILDDDEWTGNVAYVAMMRPVPIGTRQANDAADSNHYVNCQMVWLMGTTNEAGSAMAIEGDAAHDAVDNLLYSYPVKIGGRAHSATPSAVAANDRVNAYFDVYGRLTVRADELPLPTGAATQTTLAALNTKVTACNTSAVVVSSSALPSGAATAARQDTGNTSLSTIAGKDFATQTTLSALNGKVTACNTGAVAVASSALPTGAATSAKQDDALTELRIANGAMAMQVDDAGGGVTYQGWAEPGTATSAASWRIRRITESSSDYSIVFADGDRSFNNVWDNRAALSYS